MENKPQSVYEKFQEMSQAVANVMKELDPAAFEGKTPDQAFEIISNLFQNNKKLGAYTQLIAIENGELTTASMIRTARKICKNLQNDVSPEAMKNSAEQQAAEHERQKDLVKEGAIPEPISLTINLNSKFMQGIAEMLKTDKNRARDIVKEAILKVAENQSITAEQLNQPCKIVKDKGPISKQDATQEYRVAEGKTILEALTDYILCQCGKLNLENTLLNQDEKQQEQKKPEQAAQKPQEVSETPKNENTDFAIDIEFGDDFWTGLQQSNDVNYVKFSIMEEIVSKAVNVDKKKLFQKCSIENKKEGERVKEFIEDAKTVLDVITEHVIDNNSRALNVVFVSGVATITDKAPSYGNEGTSQKPLANEENAPNNDSISSNAIINQTQNIVASATSSAPPYDAMVDKYLAEGYTPEVREFFKQNEGWETEQEIIKNLGLDRVMGPTYKK